MTRRSPEIAIEWSPQEIDVYDGARRNRAADLSAYRGKAAVLALGRRSVFFRATRLPNVPREAMRPILGLKLGDLFPVPAHELAFDYLQTEDVNENGRLVVVCAVPSATLRVALESLRAAGIEVVRTVPVAFGSATLAPTGSAAVIEPAVEGYGIDVVEDGSVRYSRVVPLNANVGAEACRAFNAAGLPCGTLIAAGGAKFPDSDQNVNDSALGALLRTPPAIDLRLPEEVAKEKAGNESRNIRRSALFLLASLALAAYAYNEFDDAAAVAQQQTAHEGAASRKAAKLKKEAEAKATALVALQHAADEAFSPAQMPSDIVTSAVILAPKGLWLGGFSVERGKAVQIRGIATRNAAVAEYVKALEDSPRFRDATLLFANDAQVATKPVTQFSISAFPVGNLPLVQVGSAKPKTTAPTGTTK